MSIQIEYTIFHNDIIELIELIELIKIIINLKIYLKPYYIYYYRQSNE